MRPRILLFACTLVAGLQILPGGATPAAAQPAGALFLPADSVLGAVGYVLRDGWRYHPGDDPAWAHPGLDDTAWPVGDAHLIPEETERHGWTGVGWLRMRLRVDPALVNVPLGLHVVQAGASEIYLNGRLLYRLGRVGASAEAEVAFWDQKFPRVILFDERPEHVLAVRYSNTSTEVSRRMGLGRGFYLIVGDLTTQIEQRVERERNTRSIQTFFTAVPLAFALLHLFIFLFQRRCREHLYFALLTAAIAANNFIDLQAVFATSPMERLLLFHLSGLTLVLCALSGLRLVYYLRAGPLPRRFYLFAAAGLGLWLLRVVMPDVNMTYLLIVYALVILVEVLRVAVTTKLMTGFIGWIIGIGMILSLASIMVQLLISLHLVPFFTEVPVYYYGVLCLLLAMSLYLSERFARTNRDLEERLVEVEVLTRKTLQQERQARETEFARRLLEADNERKTRELEEARRIQLSMLPSEIPTLAHLEIAVFMKTASEVGGDYYDFHLADDGTLTIAIGDATGHGTAAGLIVATVKSLFETMAEAEDLRQIFHGCTRVIKQMRLGPLYMALQLLRIQGYRFTAASAGMPYLLLYRAETGTVEEVILKGMPLGHTLHFPYEQADGTLAPGDTFLLMSDGFAELFNDRREMFDYERVRACFGEAAAWPPEEIIAHLADTADQWRGGGLPNDDVTFVVLQVTGKRRTRRERPARHPGDHAPVRV